MSHVTCHMWNAYVDPWDMLNNFCFHVYAQKCVFVIMSHVACHMSNAYVEPWDMLNNFCFHVYAQKWVFVINYVTCRMSHVKCLLSNAHVDCWDMLNIFCFRVYAQMALFMGENGNFFDLSTLTCDRTNHRAGPQLKNVWKSDKRWEPVKF